MKQKNIFYKQIGYIKYIIECTGLMWWVNIHKTSKLGKGEVYEKQ